MEDKDNIKDLFSEKLSGFEANVRPELWVNISSQIGTTAGVSAAGGLSIVAKIIIGVSVAASIVAVGIVLVNYSEKEIAGKTNKQEIKNTEENTEENKVEEAFEIREPQIKINQQEQTKTEDYNNEFLNEAHVVDPINNKSDAPPHDLNKEIVAPEKKPAEESILVEENVLPTKEITSLIAQHENSIIEAKSIESATIIDLPNVFTPNGDRANDFLSIKSSGELKDFNVVIIDQKSNIVYKSNDPNFVWDGIGINGEMVLSGNYIYYITASDSEGKLINKHSLLRIER